MASSSGSMEGRILKRADARTIQDKFLVGYQGWFTCAGDGEPLPGHDGWLHWVNKPLDEGGRINTDLWPCTDGYSPSELFRLPGLNYPNGDPTFVFSSRHPKTVQRHFNLMAKYGVDGAFLQRFVGQCDCEGGGDMLKIRDEVGDRVKEAAEKEGRVFAIMYDVSGVNPDDLRRIIEKDWMHLIRDKGILDSPAYLREKGKAVVNLWGFGMNGNDHNPHVIRAIIHFIRDNTPGGAYIIGGSPAHWRTSTGDADPDPEFLKVWLNEFDAISPWTIGRYGNEEDADRFADEKIKGDVELLRKRHEEGHRQVDYMPVVLPGGSGFNLSEGKWGFNDIKRNGGRFLWRQIFNVKRNGVRIIYGAMWDEYDEGTAFMPVVSRKSQLPSTDQWPFLALDAEGYNLPPDWYMRICGFAAEGLRSERRIHDEFPSKELEDYWSSRPKYEEAQGNEAGSSGSTVRQDYQAWSAEQKDDTDEPPPPPYSMETVEAAAAAGPSTIALAASRPMSPAPPLPIRPDGTGSRQNSDMGVGVLANDFDRQANIYHSPASPPLPPQENLPADLPTSPLGHVAPPSISVHSRPPMSPGGTCEQWPPSDWSANQMPPAHPSFSRPAGSPGFPSSFSQGPQQHPFMYPQPHVGPPGQNGPQFSQGPSFPMGPGGYNSHYSVSSQAPSPYHQHGSGSLGNRYGHQPTSPAQLYPHGNPPSERYSPQSNNPGTSSSLVAPSTNPHTKPGFSSMAPTGAGPSVGMGPLGYAMQAVDNFAGEERRRQLERGVGSLTKTGTKLLSKWTNK